MDINFFKANLYNPAIFIPQIRKEWKSYFERKAFLQYDPVTHEIVMDRVKRKDKEIQKPTGETDPNTGDPITTTATIPIARIPLALQRLIVARAVAFLTGGKLELKCKPASEKQKKLYDLQLDVWKKNKLTFKNAQIAEAFMSETECAEIWFSKPNEDKSVSLRMNVYSPSRGFELIPVFDYLGDLIAFGLGYETTEGDKKVKHMDIYDDKKLTRYIAESSDWQRKEQIDHGYGKIPVIYYNLERAIWADVQTLIERLETIISNFADTNDYNGSPILFAKGQINGWSAKGETGKVIEGVGPDAELQYVNWDSAPESIKLEIETILDFIYTITQTPNISFKELKGLGDISGVAFDRIMIDAHLKAKKFQNGMFGECIQRRINFLNTALIETNPGQGLEAAADIDITPEFSIFTIDDIADRISNAKAANGGLPVLDHRSSIVMAGLAEDPEATFETLEKQRKQLEAAAKQPTNVGVG